jgi:hypothetical protein
MQRPFYKRVLERMVITTRRKISKRMRDRATLIMMTCTGNHRHCTVELGRESQMGES